MSPPAYAGQPLAVGDVVTTGRYPVQRINLVMYAGAAGDFNPIHWNERIATSVGLPNVIAHGMFTMAQAVRAVTDWVTDSTLVESVRVRFTSPVVVADDDRGARINVQISVAELLADGRVQLDITAHSDDQQVLGQATAVVRLPEVTEQ
jgi:acyl dehydratase